MTSDELQSWIRVVVGPFAAALVGGSAAYLAIKVDIATMQVTISSIEKMAIRDREDIKELRAKLEKEK